MWDILVRFLKTCCSELFFFCFLQDTEVLDSTVYRDRANLGRKRGHRAPVTRSGGVFSESDWDSWMFKDSTDGMEHCRLGLARSSHVASLRPFLISHIYIACSVSHIAYVFEADLFVYAFLFITRSSQVLLVFGCGWDFRQNFPQCSIARCFRCYTLEYFFHFFMLGNHMVI